MSDLWGKIDQIDQQIAALEKQKKQILQQLRCSKLPSMRDLKITLAYLNDRKVAQIAAEFGISPGRVSHIVKKCRPFLAKNA